MSEFDPLRPVRIAMTSGSFYRTRKWRCGERMSREVKAAIKAGHIEHEGRGHFVATEAGRRAVSEADRARMAASKSGEVANVL